MRSRSWLDPTVPTEAQPVRAQVVGRTGPSLYRTGQRPARDPSPGRLPLELKYGHDGRKQVRQRRRRVIQPWGRERPGGVRNQHGGSVTAPRTVIGNELQHRVAIDEGAVEVLPAPTRPAAYRVRAGRH